MRVPLAVILILVFTCAVFAQATETKYYRDRPFEAEVKESKAIYARTTSEENGVKTVTVRNLTNNVVEQSESLRGDEPMGIWVIQMGTEVLDFDFELSYGPEKCSKDSTLKTLGNPFLSQGQYTAPVINYSKDFLSFLMRSVRYPTIARRKHIQGKVMLSFVITKEGIVDDVTVVKGVHVSLDKEAVRVIRKLSFTSPPMFNGKPTGVCVNIPMPFNMR